MCVFAMKWLACGIISLLLGVCHSTPKNVLILDVLPSPSHQVWMHRLTRALADHGYNVTTLTCVPIKHPPENLHVYHLKDMHNMGVGEEVDFLKFTAMSPWETFAMLNGYFDITDKMLMEAASMKAMKARLIGASAYPSIEYTDRATMAPHFPSFVPNLYQNEVKDTFSSRLQNFLVYFWNDMMTEYKLYPASERIIKQYYETKRSLAEIVSSTTILLANHNPVMDTVTPTMPNVIPVGGLQIEDPKPLPVDLEEVFASAKKGVILFSLGTNVKSESLGRKRLDVIVETLAEFLEYNIVWKIDLSNMTLRLPKNVFVRQWLPQSDILADNRTKLFISHAGGLSTQEATWHGKPMLAIPFMLDQFSNAKEAVKCGIAIQFDIKSCDKKQFKSAVIGLLNNDKYLNAVQLRSKNFQDQKEKPIERALWWIDYVARNPDVSFLKSTKLQKMNYFHKHSIDVIVVLTILILVIVLGMAKCTWMVVMTTKRGKDKMKLN